MFAYRLGETLMFDRGRVDEAIAYFRIQKRLDPDQAGARKVLGYAYNRRGYDLLKAGRRKAAIASFETALAYDPGRPEIAANLAMAKRQKGIIGK
jgi:Flp pilus assembly protein TadD